MYRKSINHLNRHTRYPICKQFYPRQKSAEETEEKSFTANENSLLIALW